MYKKQRIEALSDGIFAIAMTLLILDLKVPTTFPHGHIWEALKPQDEEWLSFVLTFGLAARFWTLQHDVFQVVDNVGRHALICTFIFLGLVTALPFTTSLLGAHFSDVSVLTLYLFHELAIAATLVTKLEICGFHEHIGKDAVLTPLRLRLYGVCVTLIACLLSVWLLPLRWLWVMPLALGMAERRLSFIHKRKQQNRLAVSHEP